MKIAVIEPMLDTSNPLLSMPNVTCTPHLGYVEESTYEAIYALAIEQLLAYAEGKPINLLKE